MKRDKKDFYQKLSGLVMPIAFQNFMLAAVSASDAFMIGMLSQTSFSAVSLAGQIAFVLSLFLAAFTIGTTILSAQYWGKKDIEAVEKIMGIALKITIVTSCIFCFFAIFFPRLLMIIFTNDLLLIEKGMEYLRIVGISYVFMGISQIYLCIMKNSGQVIKSTVISSVSVVINIILNAVLIFGLFGMPRMEIKGAALATVLAKAIELVWVYAESLRENRIRAKFKFILHTDRVLQKDFFRYSAPVLGNELVWGCGFTMYSVVMGHMGSDAVAANSIANIIKNLIACFCNGLGNGGEILIGNELGAGNLDTAKKYGDRLCHISIITGVVSGGIILLLSPIIVGSVNLNETANQYLKVMLCVCSYYMIGKAVNTTVISGIFCAGGDSKFGFLCDAVTMWCVTVPLGLLLAFVFHMPVLTVYFVMNLDEIVKLPAVYKHYKKYQWVKNLTRTIEGRSVV